MKQEKEYHEWDAFIQDGGKTIHDREKWVAHIFQMVKQCITDCNDTNLSTCSGICTTTLNNSYVRGQVFPFVNIPIRYMDKELLGVFEYFERRLPYSDAYMYCDFVVQSIYYASNKHPDLIQEMEKRARSLFAAAGYNIIQFEDGMATIQIDRKVLEDEEAFLRLLKTLLNDARSLQKEFI
jgi:hypothetical protein